MRKTTLIMALLVVATGRAQLYTEGFVDINTLTDWDFVNVSTLPPPSGETGWFQGVSDTFSAYDGDANSYLAVDSKSSECCLISNWAILPAFTLKDGDRFSFYTRTVANSNRPDRLEVRLSVEGIGSALPSTEAELGSFETLLLTINESQEIGGYPEEWELQTIEISDLGAPTSVRIAFRYYVTNAGINGINSNYVGIDSVSLETRLNNDSPNEIDLKYRLGNDGKLYLETPEVLDSVTIFNVVGQEVMHQIVGHTKVELDISHLLSGIYLLQAEMDGHIATKRFVKL